MTDSFLGMRIIVSEHAVRITVSEERLFPASRHRSAGIHKKLVKRYGGEFKVKIIPITYVMGNTMFTHPTLYEELKRHAKR